MKISKKRLFRQLCCENKNVTFWIPFLLVGLIATIILLQIEKSDLIRYFSENRTDFHDSFYAIVTKLGEPIAFIIIGLLLLARKYIDTVVLIIMSAVLTILSFVLKSLFAHPRPRIFLGDLIGSEIIPVEGIHIFSGHTSFPSGHTMAGFALFTYVALLIKSPIVKILSLIIAIFVGLSRVYLIQHFYEDIYFGMWLGVFVGGLAYLLNQYLFLKNEGRFITKGISLTGKRGFSYR